MQIKNQNAQHWLMVTRERGRRKASTDWNFTLFTNQNSTYRYHFLLVLYHHPRFDIALYDRLHHYSVPLRLTSERASRNEYCYLCFTYTDFFYSYIYKIYLTSKREMEAWVNLLTDLITFCFRQSNFLLERKEFAKIQKTLHKYLEKEIKWCLPDA